MRFLISILLLFPVFAWSQANLETHDFSFEYGLAYHTLEGTQKSNNTTGRLTSSQNPYYNASYTYRFSQNYGARLFGGIQFVQFNEPKFGTLVAETKLMNHFGLEILKKTGPYTKFGIFMMQQDHPLYFAETPTDFRILRRSFAQTGAHFSVGQRRRIGLLWGAGLKAYHLFPTKGGNLATETGYGYEAYARLGWVGFLGALYQVKGFYGYAEAPNAEANFNHSALGYALMISYSF